ncbi:MAG: hypothetical protein O7D91_03825 [Planctomycetota bacterium]|nr:hypothetical protein [Planctomycetota bacterium]
MIVHWAGWIVVGLALFLAGWFAFEGGRALVVGDYITPKSGKYAGQLGPWSKVVSAVGIEPRSTLMKSIFLVFGVVWIGITICFVLKLHWAWWAMLIAAAGSLWYLPFGTLLGVVQIVVLLMPALRTPVSLN